MWFRRLLGVGAAVLLALGLWNVPSAAHGVRNRRERGYCRREYTATVANHKGHVAAGESDPYYEEHFVKNQDFTSRCLAVEKCQRHGLFGMGHGPRRKCWSSELFPN